MSWPITNCDCKRSWEIIYDFVERKVPSRCIAVVIDSNGNEVERVMDDGCARSIAENLAIKHGIPYGGITRRKLFLKPTCRSKTSKWFDETFALEEEIEF